jgi:hypothetical protein
VRGGAVAGRPETRVDGHLSPQAKKLVLQVSKWGCSISDARGRLGGNIIYCVSFAMYDL